MIENATSPFNLFQPFTLQIFISLAKMFTAKEAIISTTTLNGLPIASPNPDHKLIPLDLFPSSTVKNITVSKVYEANSFADYSGAHIDIGTKEQTAACGDEERMTEPTVSSGLLPNQGNQEIPANELQQYID